MSVGEQIVVEARSWIGTPYRHQASIKGVGVDCYGLVWGITNALEELWTPPRVRRYGEQPSDTMKPICDAHMIAIPREEIALGDVLLIRFFSHWQHLAIYCGETVVHAMANIDRASEHNVRGYLGSPRVLTYRLRRAR
ncbi:MAG TPA: NlpC/P60 family protein [Gammaproteobacteria bacterium]|nr:NlpC/P60 family protein [Gammaproteobacteria bacterium]